MNYLMDANPAEAFINSGGVDVAYLGRLATAWDGRGFRTDKPLSDDEWQRLINLVAAAPAMFAALRECEKHLHWMFHQTGRKEYMKASDDARAALNKAEWGS